MCDQTNREHHRELKPFPRAVATEVAGALPTLKGDNIWSSLTEYAYCRALNVAVLASAPFLLSPS
jgi:hypothetical protein